MGATINQSGAKPPKRCRIASMQAKASLSFRRSNGSFQFHSRFLFELGNEASISTKGIRMKNISHE